MTTESVKRGILSSTMAQLRFDVLNERQQFEREPLLERTDRRRRARGRRQVRDEVAKHVTTFANAEGRAFLRDADLLRLHAAGPAHYYEPGLEIVGRVLGLHERVTSQSTVPLPDRGGLAPEAQRIVSSLGSRPRKAKLRAAIFELASSRPGRPWDLADIADFDIIDITKPVERHLRKMVAQCLLERVHQKILATLYRRTV